jgi:hypothetical protein
MKKRNALSAILFRFDGLILRGILTAPQLLSEEKWKR